ncbi:NADH:flavin oxidoreductase/NADH oxidase [Rhizobium alvei]|uniref:NADH:flavin oxidoreductase/NADH oxidase n=1 Tax=Rhizobium alvei TaxID=1132659 RepID=A0ABT8YMY3_9HYPH|nr:NADH:flavin oxidoreductase/NADH oxidase [Rhizobium alvei]MDO6965085.1 NADH:flavin oxidoreductase/NADH oxidase [Rhizobium alvei]
MSALFSPARLGGLQLNNRIVVSPMCQYSARDGIAQPWHLIHIGNLMMSGAGLVIMEATGVDAQGRGTLGCLGLYSDAQEEALAELVRQVRPLSSAKIGIQLQHAGRKASTRSIAERWKGEPLPMDEGGWPVCGPSSEPFDKDWQVPQAMSHADIGRIIDSFAAAAVRADRAGFDLVEIHAAHGYLIHQFLSPLTNRREDAYGGSPENRMRLALEIATAVRAVWSQEKALGFRLTSTDWHEDGLTLDDAVVLAGKLKAIGIDYCVMSAGNIAPGIKIPPASPGHQVDFATRVGRETGLTVMAVGMIGQPKEAEAIIAEGRADFVAIGRAMLDDPRWGLHAAAALGVDVDYPPQYLRARPNNWTGYRHIHPETPHFQASRQADRPASMLWDRPDDGPQPATEEVVVSPKTSRL